MLTRQQMEHRRLAAARDLKRGVPTSVVRMTYGVSRMTISRWNQAVNAGKPLQRRRATGRRRLCDYEKLRELFIRHRDMPFREIAEIIQARYGIKYDPDHVSKIARALGMKRRQAA